MADKKKKIPEEKIQEIRSKLVTMRNEARSSRDLRDVKTTERQAIYYADVDYYNQMFPILADTSQSTDSSVAQAIERRLASLMRIFLGGKSVGRICGTTSQYDDQADKMDALVNQQLEQQGFFNKCFQWLKDADIQLVGCIKVTWDEEREEVEEQQLVTVDDLNRLEEAGSLIHSEITSQTDGQGRPTYMAAMQYSKIINARPLVDNVPLNELLYMPNARSLDKDECTFVAHSKKVTMSHLYENVKTKNGGMYDREALDHISTTSNVNTVSRSEAERQEQPFVQPVQFGDSNTIKMIDECYFAYDIDDDGVNEQLVATLCDDDFIRFPEINEEDDHPFCLLIHGRDPHRIMPDTGMIDRAGQIQHVIVAVIRQIQTAFALGSNPQAFIDSSRFVDIDQLIDGLSVVEIHGDPNTALKWRDPAPIQQWAIEYIEQLRSQIELVTGITRYNQGTDATSLNKTASGMQQIISQGNQALEFVARQDAETGFKRLIERFIFLNQFYQKDRSDPITVRQHGKEDLTIDAKELQGQYIYQTDVGIGAGTREMNLQLLQQLKAEAPTLVQSGLMNLEGAYNLTKKSYEEAGLVNIGDYLQDPAQVPPKPPQPPQVHWSDMIKLDFATLPDNVKAQIIGQLGFQCNPQDFAAIQAQQVETQGHLEAQKAIISGVKDGLLHSHKSGTDAFNNGLKEIVTSHLVKQPVQPQQPKNPGMSGNDMGQGA